MSEIGGFGNASDFTGASIFLLSQCCCCSIKSENDFITIKDRLCLIDEDMNEVENASYIVTTSSLKADTYYHCVKKWDILNNGTRIKTYDTEEEAKTAFDEIVAELTKDKKVIKLD